MKILTSVMAALAVLCLDVTAEQGQPSLEPPLTPLKYFKEEGVVEDLEHAVIFDAGSTGTRIYIHAFKWEPMECYGRGAATVYMPGWTKKVKPGLATTWLGMKDEPNSRALLHDYFAPLREFFNETLLPSQQQEVLMLFRATGGFRYLSFKDQEEALDAVYSELLTWGGQTRRKWIRVLTGNEEGAFSWLALNQLARRFFGQFEHVALHPRLKGSVSPDENTPIGLSDNWRAEAAGSAGRTKKRRVGVVEVGGASAQIAVEPPRKLAKRLMNEADPWLLRQREPVLANLGEGYHVLHFCHENVVLQIRSLDGYGRQAALQRFVRFASNNSLAAEVEVPCLPADIRLPISDEVDLETLEMNEEIGLKPAEPTRVAVGMKTADAEECKSAMQSFLKASLLDPLPFDLDPDYRIYATENFYYFNRYVNMANHSLFSIQDFWDSAKQVCAARNSAEVRQFIHDEASSDKTASGCFGLVFLSELLKHAVSLTPSTYMKAVTSVKELETNFALGSLILELPLAMRDHVNGGHQVRKPSARPAGGGGDDEL